MALFPCNVGGGGGSSEIDRTNAVVIANNIQSFDYTAVANGIVVAVNNGGQGGLTTKLNGTILSGYSDFSYGSGGVRLMVVNVSTGDVLSFQSSTSGWKWGATFYPYM